MHNVAGMKVISNNHPLVSVVSETPEWKTVEKPNPRIGQILSWERIINQTEIECMAKNIYFEAAIESTAGQLAVAQVTLNRVKSKHYPNTVCEVVYEGPHHASGHPKRDRCQFSWYCDGKDDEVRNKGKLWDNAHELAKYVLTHYFSNDLMDITDGATHYHANYIDAPNWAHQKRVKTKIDTHIFYGGRKGFNF